MKKLNGICILVWMLCFFSACNFQINCPGLNNEILEWIPYKNNETIVLMNSTDDSILQLEINDVVVEHTTHYTTNTKCGRCDDNLRVNGNETSNPGLQINMNFNINNITHQSFTIEDSYFFGDSQSSEYTDYTFEGVKYDAVQIFENSRDQRFTKLILAKGDGIIALIDKEGHTWLLKEINAASTPVEIINIACD